MIEPSLALEPDLQDRFPILHGPGRAMLRRLIEDPAAPIYRNQSGHRLIEADLPQLAAFEARMQALQVTQAAHQQIALAPIWLQRLIQRSYTQVPFYRANGAPPKYFQDIAPITRAELSADVVQFVPDDISAARIIHYSTSGTTGHALMLPSHPRVAAGYRVFYELALARFGVTLRAGANDVGLLLIGHQQRCFTYVSVTPTRGESGLAKINLHANDWRDLGDRERYIDALQAELYSGDPLAFTELLTLATQHRPAALVSTSMTLLPALRQSLSARFDCPVLDLYSMNEAGPIAVFDAELDGYVLLQPELNVEILRPDGSVCAIGERGEITLSGGFNFCLPLLRYRTGDFASLVREAGEWLLRDLSGRAPVRYQTCSGAWLNNIDVTHALKPYALAQWTLLQRSDQALELAIQPYRPMEANAIEKDLRALFGQNQALTIGRIAPNLDKVVQYRSEL